MNCVWDAYNQLMLSSDSDRLRKVLARASLYEMVTNVPGAVVECGVLKGVGLMTWGKLMHIHGDERRLVGFDVFSGFASQETPFEQLQADRLEKWSNFEGVDPGELRASAVSAGFDVELVAGRIEKTAEDWAQRNPVTKIALLNLDLDFYRPTLAALRALWPMVADGGIVVFDEYGVEEFTETRAVDEFFCGRFQAKTIPWAKSPTAYMVKVE